MKLKFLKKYFSIIFVVATLMGVFHHHHDLKPHTDCQICTIQSSIADADTPTPVVYLTSMILIHDDHISQNSVLHLNSFKNPLHARAPPLFS